MGITASEPFGSEAFFLHAYRGLATSISNGNNGTAPGKPKAVCKEALVKLGKCQKALAERLLAVCDADELDADLQKQLALVMEIFNGLGEAPPTGRRAKHGKGPQ